MHALTFDRFGPAEVLRWTERPDPQPGPGQVLVRMQSVGLNFADVYRRNGNYHLSGAAPWVLGYEGPAWSSCRWPATTSSRRAGA